MTPLSRYIFMLCNYPGIVSLQSLPGKTYAMERPSCCGLFCIKFFYVGKLLSITHYEKRLQGMETGCLIALICFPIAILAAIIGVIVESAKKKKNQKKELETSGASVYAELPHTAGLPIAENATCKVYSFPDRIEIKGGGTQFTLSRSKVTDISIITDKEIQKQVVSSVGGAVAGGVLFGPIGAMIGGRAKQRTSTTVRYYLIFSYEKDDSVSYIAFEATQSLSNASKFAKEFHAGEGGTGKKIEL